jgi:hypothetical protein
LKLRGKKQGDKLPDTQNFGERGEEGETLELFAKKVSSNKETVRQALWLMDNAPKEELESLRSDERAISNLYKETKRYLTKIEEAGEESYEIPEVHCRTFDNVLQVVS